jgi:hypothetical protein
MSRNTKIGLGVCAALLLAACCCGLVILAAGGLFFFEFSRQVSSPVFAPPSVATRTPTVVLAARQSPTPSPTRPAPPTGPTPITSGTPAGDSRPLADVLAQTTMTPRDLRVLAQRLQGAADIPITVAAAPADHALGTVLDFNIHNDDNEAQPHSVVAAELLYKTENVYFFAERGLDVDHAAVRALVDEFQAETYPTNRDFFGSEWNPGVDGDPRLYILFARGLGFSILGYYYPVDEYSRLAYPYSNEKEIFYVNADVTYPGDPELASTLAHEFQHMIHWHQDRDEPGWVNEGSAMLAELLNGFQPLGHAGEFIDQPDLQLTTWSDGNTIPHYGAAFLFLAYFLDRFGDETTRALMAHPANGLEAVDAVLAERGLRDPATGQPLAADQVLADWAVTNLLNDPEAADGRYAYRRLAGVPTVTPAAEFRRCPAAAESYTVNQHAADYFVISCAGAYTLSFAGATQVPVVPADPDGSRFAFWSNRGDESVSALTRSFDLTGLASATLTYSAWWDIEADYDYGYLEVSADDGRTWTILRAPGTTDADPNGANFGWGYTGQSGRWVEETVDLSAYAGQVVWVRFEYITDAMLNTPGWLIDDVRVPELGYAADFEQDAGGWEAEGFVRLENALPQRFTVQVVRQAGGQTTVERLPLDDANRGQASLTLDRGDTVTVVVMALTRQTTEFAEYRLSLDAP